MRALLLLLYIATINTNVELRTIGENEGKICDADSIWRSCDGGKSWLRIWHKELAGTVMDPTNAYNWPCWRLSPQVPVIEWMTIELVPGETTPTTIYMADLGTETVWVSTASGDACCPAGLGCWTDRNTGLGMWPDDRRRRHRGHRRPR